MTLDEAIAEVNGTYPPDEPWIAGAFEADGWPFHQALAIAAILNAVASGELAKSGWQPIATAPRDGTRVDLWMVDQDGRAWREADAYYVTDMGYGAYDLSNGTLNMTRKAKRDGWFAPNHDYDGQDGWCDEPEYFNQPRGKVVFTLPTHWMPLPQPPALADHGPTERIDAAKS